jgi:hypothetical protein
MRELRIVTRTLVSFIRHSPILGAAEQARQIRDLPCLMYVDHTLVKN